MRTTLTLSLPRQIEARHQHRRKCWKGTEGSESRGQSTLTQALGHAARQALRGVVLGEGFRPDGSRNLVVRVEKLAALHGRSLIGKTRQRDDAHPLLAHTVMSRLPGLRAEPLLHVQRVLGVPLALLAVRQRRVGAGHIDAVVHLAALAEREPVLARCVGHVEDKWARTQSASRLPRRARRHPDTTRASARCNGNRRRPPCRTDSA